MLGLLLGLVDCMPHVFRKCPIWAVLIFIESILLFAFIITSTAWFRQLLCPFGRFIGWDCWMWLGVISFKIHIFNGDGIIFQFLDALIVAQLLQLYIDFGWPLLCIGWVQRWNQILDGAILILTIDIQYRCEHVNFIVSEHMMFLRLSSAGGEVLSW